MYFWKRLKLRHQTYSHNIYFNIKLTFKSYRHLSKVAKKICYNEGSIKYAVNNIQNDYEIDIGFPRVSKGHYVRLRIRWVTLIVNIQYLLGYDDLDT